MIIQEIIIKDFRPFYGTQKIILSKNIEKNLTIINAENGSGKTSLLEAIKWCLYGKMLNLPNKDDFANKRTIAETPIDEIIDVSITIKFQDNDHNYVVKRTNSFKRKSNFDLIKNNSQLTLQKINLITGESRTIPNPEMEISNIIPSDINFFFDGERLTEFDNKKTLKSAIEGVLGVKSSINAIKHLKLVKKEIENELMLIEKNMGNETSFHLINVEQRLNEEKENLKEKIKENLKEQEEAKKILSKLDEKLSEIKVIEVLVNSKKGLEKELNDLKKEEEETRNLIMDRYRNDAYYSPILSLVKDVNKILVEKKSKKEVPSKVSEYLIKEILDEKICICGREVEEDSPEYETLTRLRKKSTTDNMATAFERALDFTKDSKIKRKNFYSEIKLLKSRLESIEGKKENKQGALAEIENKIGENKTEEVQKLRETIMLNKNKLYNLVGESGHLKSKREDCEKKIQETNNKKRRIESSSDSVRILRKRVDFTKELIENIEKLLQLKKDSIRKNLNSKIQKIYDKATRKGYKIRLDDDFMIDIIDPTTNFKAPVSTGEQKIATLCFIGALADLAREIHNRESDMETGKIFPIVLDSPFGDLDSEHKEKVAELLPLLADQVVLLASTSQYTEEVKKHMFPRVGEAYQLYNRNPKQHPEVKHEFTNIYRRVNGEWIK